MVNKIYSGFKELSDLLIVLQMAYIAAFYINI